MDKFNEEHMRALEQRYSELVNPRKLIEYLSTPEEFEDWARLGTPSDIRSALIAFEKEELYDHCAILKKVLISIESNE
jgi:hypothetical protein